MHVLTDWILLLGLTAALWVTVVEFDKAMSKPPKHDETDVHARAMRALARQQGDEGEES